VVLALVAGIFLPAMLPARGAPIPDYVWVIGSAALFVCVVTTAMALLRRTFADRIAGGAAGFLTLWMIYAFYGAISYQAGRDEPPPCSTAHERYVRWPNRSTGTALV
jgi:hypothetical protein